MSDSPEQWTDTDLVAQCEAGNPAAWNRLKEMFVEEAKAIIARCRRYGHLTAELIGDAVQNVLFRLWKKHADMQATVRAEDGELRKYLIAATCRQVENLLAKEQRRHKHEQQASAGRKESRTEPDVQEEAEAQKDAAERLLSELRADDQKLLRAALEGTLAELLENLTETEYRNSKRRMRRKWRERNG